MKYFFVGGILSILIMSACDQQHTEQVNNTDPVQVKFSKQVEKVLAQKLSLLKTQLLEEVIHSAIIQSNKNNSDLNQKQITELDQKWRTTEGTDSFIRSYLTNPCAQSLINFQRKYKGFSEIFVTDKYGLNVCQTNKTSDLFQADEQWWQACHNEGKGYSYFGDVEYDESSQTESIPIYAPIIDQTNNRVIGVAKAVLDITQIKREI